MMPDQGPVVIIGLQQIYDKLVALEAIVGQLVHQHNGTVKDVDDHEARLRTLEKSRWPLPAVAVLLSAGSLGVALFVALT